MVLGGEGRGGAGGHQECGIFFICRALFTEGANVILHAINLSNRFPDYFIQQFQSWFDNPSPLHDMPKLRALDRTGTWYARCEGSERKTDE